MSDTVDRVQCFFCKHFEFYPGSPGYSEFTPGSDMEMRCRFRHWDGQDLYGNNGLAEAFQRAKTCADFTPEAA